MTDINNNYIGTSRRSPLASFDKFLFVTSLVYFIGMNAAGAAELPTSTGEFGVATHTYYFTDDAREEVWTPEVGDSRRLGVQIFYPVEPAYRGERAPYFPLRDANAANLAEYLAAKGFTRLKLEDVPQAEPETE